MFENKTEEQAKKEILDMVAGYCHTFHGRKKTFEPGDRIPYASRVYDQEEMCNLVDSALEFWHRSGRGIVGRSPGRCAGVYNNSGYVETILEKNLGGI